jgi:hypothetical protein
MNISKPPEQGRIRFFARKDLDLIATGLRSIDRAGGFDHHLDGFSIPRISAILALKCAGEYEPDLYLFFDPQHEGAGIFKAPGSVGDGDRSGSLAVRIENLNGHGQFDVVGYADESKHPLHGENRFACARESAGEVRWLKSDFGKTLRFEYLGSHTAIACSVSTVSAGGAHDDGSAHVSGGALEENAALLQMKGPVHGMDNATEGEIHLARRRVECAGFLSEGLGRRCGGRCKQVKADAYE